MSSSDSRAESRERILEAAKQVFFEDGFEAANLDEVARRAGLAKGTIYRYFTSKAELYVEVLVLNADAFVERMRRLIDPRLDAAQQMRNLGLFYFHHYAENPEYFRIFWALENQRMIGDLPLELVRAVSDLWRRCLEILAEQIERGVKDGVFGPCDPWETANILWSMANGLIQSDGAAERRALRGGEVERVFRNALDLLIRGLQSESGLAPGG